MAITDVLVPQLSESVSEATLLTWKKQAGAAVEADEILIEIETDKVVLEVPAPSSGVLSEIVMGDGSTVTSGEVIARIDTASRRSPALMSSTRLRTAARHSCRNTPPGPTAAEPTCRPTKPVHCYTVSGSARRPQIQPDPVARHHCGVS